MTQTNAQQNDKLLRHVVLFKFKETSSAADVKKVEDAFIYFLKAYPWWNYLSQQAYPEKEE